MTYTTTPIKTDYIKPGEGYNKIIINSIDKCQDNDYLIISETPLSVAQNNLIDESKYKSGITATILTEIWAKRLWGYVLAPLLHYKQRTITNLRKMPKEARQHKQMIIEEYGLKHAFQPSAEAGVDLSNVPGPYVSLLPENPSKIAKDIHDKIKIETSKSVNVIIIDTDSTYQYHNQIFTTLPIAVDKIKHDMGIYGYILGRFSKELGPTIIATSFKFNDIYELIKLAKIAEECQNDNADKIFETIYNMQDTFNENPTGITVDMLSNLTHIPAVLIHKK